MEPFLDHLRTRGAMYLWGWSWHRYGSLVDFLNGYQCAQGTEPLAIHDRCWEFTDWLLNVKNLPGTRNTRWEGVIRAAYPTEEERFDAFLTLYEEFLTQNPEKYVVIRNFGPINDRLKILGVSQADRNDLENILDELKKAKTDADRKPIADRGIDWLKRNGKNKGISGVLNLIEQWISRGVAPKGP
jgi:hypothetical protein